MRRYHIALLVLSLAALTHLLGFRLNAAPGPLPPLVNLAPGTDLRIQQDVDVNVVLVGFGGLVNPADMLALPYALPQWNGVPKANGKGQTFIGQRFDFSYHITVAPAPFEDAFFTLLRQTAFPQAPVPIFQGLPPMPLTPAQAVYNYCNLDPSFDPGHGCSFDPSAPRVNTRFITQNYLLDATFVEKVLSQNMGLLGVDVTKPTVVLLNWWGRPDYVDHIYLDGSEPDPETGFPRGFTFNNELAGYGGTSDKDPETCQGDCIFHRLWFYDVSAGPMARTGGFDLVADIPRVAGATNFGLPYPDYRFHHTADYVAASGTYRPLTKDDLVWDSTALAGLVFTSQLAYAGPLYPPALTPPTLPRRLVMDINQWSWSGQSFAGLLDTPRLISKMSALPYEIGVEVTPQRDGLDSKLGRVWKCTLTSFLNQTLGQSCYGNRNAGYAPGDLQAYFTDHLFQFLNGAPDYEVPIFQFNVPEELQQWWIGIAEVNNLYPAPTPTIIPATRQSFVYTSKSPFLNSFRGDGEILEHEVGHHLGFSHSFGGYQCLSETCGLGEFYPFFGNPFLFFSLSGNYVTGLMTYVAVNNDYSRFELDNIQRWLTWEYLDVSNFIVAQIASSPRSGSVAAALTQADTLAGAALNAYKAYDHASAVQSARAAYDTLVAAAGAINVHLSPSAYQAIRRDPNDFNQALRDHIASSVGDRKDLMSGALADGIRGLEAHPLVQSTSPIVNALTHPARTSLR